MSMTTNKHRPDEVFGWYLRFSVKDLLRILESNMVVALTQRTIPFVFLATPSHPSQHSDY